MEGPPIDLVRKELQGQSLVSNLEFHEFVKALKRNGRSIYHMAFGQSPFPAMKHAQLELKKSVSQNDYVTVHGLQEFRQAISRFHEKFDGFTVDPDNIVVSPGSKEVIYHILTAFSGDIVLLSPTWTTYEPQARITRHKIHVVPVDLNTSWKLTPEILTKAVKENCIQSPSLLILCNPDNPTGIAYTEEELKALGECLRQEKFIVLSDEIYARTHFSGQHVSLYKFYREGTIVCSGFSKWASAGGWRVGYAMFPDELSQIKNAVTTTASLTYSCAPAPMQYALTEALLQEKECEQYIQLTTKILATIADFCYRELDEVGVKVIRPQAGYYMLPDFEILRPKLEKYGVMNGKSMCINILEEANVALMAAGPSFLHPETRLTARMCFVNFDGAEALEAAYSLSDTELIKEEFIVKYCSPVIEAIMALKTWVQKILAS